MFRSTESILKTKRPDPRPLSLPPQTKKVQQGQKKTCRYMHEKRSDYFFKKEHFLIVHIIPHAFLWGLPVRAWCVLILNLSSRIRTKPIKKSLLASLAAARFIIRVHLRPSAANSSLCLTHHLLHHPTSIPHFISAKGRMYQKHQAGFPRLFGSR